MAAREMRNFSSSVEKFRISKLPCNILYLLYKHQWNTRWAFARKHDIFTCEKNTVAMATQYVAIFSAKIELFGTMEKKSTNL